jgi:hypothetical protein
MSSFPESLRRIYPKGSQPPEGYVQWHDWARAQHLHGLRQQKCRRCGLFYFPQEADKHKHCMPFRDFRKAVITGAADLRRRYSGDAAFKHITALDGKKVEWGKGRIPKRKQPRRKK